MSDDRIRGVLKLPGFAAEPVELALDSGAIRKLVGPDVEVTCVLVGNDGRLVCYIGGDLIANFIRVDGALVCGTALWLFENHDGEPESLRLENACELARALDEASPFPVREDRAS